MEHTNPEVVRIKYLVHFNGSFWTVPSLEIAEKDKELLRTSHSCVAISEFIEYIDNGTVVKHEERRLQ